MGSQFIRWLYATLLYLLMPLVWLKLIRRAKKQPEYALHKAERWGFYADLKTTRPLIWIHAVSVGETRAAEPLIQSLLAEYPSHDILLSCMTPTGRATGTACYGANTHFAGRIHQAYLPYDYPDAVTRFLKTFRPIAGLLMETEIWPNLMAACQARKIPVALVNARLSAHSAKGYQRFAWLIRPAFAQLTAVAAQTEADAQRIRTLGAPQVTVCGNLKFDVAIPAEKLSLGQHWQNSLGTRPVWLAASTREGEEADLLAAHKQVLQQYSDALMILVPRHPQRFDQVATLVKSQGLTMTRRSVTEADINTQVWLGDSMGEMPAYYAVADIAIIGGSWQPLGGQNLIEAAACGCPIVVGPHTFNFTQATEDAIAAGAAIRLNGTDAIAKTLIDFWQDEKMPLMQSAALTFSAAHQGATARTLEIVTKLI